MISRRSLEAGPAAILAGLVLAGTVSCANGTNPAHAGPGGELDVTFHPGVSKKAASQIVKRCTADSADVIRTSLHLTNGEPRQYVSKIIAKSTIGKQSRNQLSSCFHKDKAVANAGWPA